MLKVPGFFAGKKSGLTPEKPGVVKKAPMVVVRSGKLVPEIFRTDKESLEAHIEGNMEPVFQDVNPQKPKLSTDEGIKEDVMLHHPEQAEKKVSDEAFEEEIRRLDKETKKYNIILTIPEFLA